MDTTLRSDSEPVVEVKVKRVYNYFFGYFFGKAGEEGSGVGNACYALDHPLVSYRQIMGIQQKLTGQTGNRWITIMNYQLLSVEDVPEGEMGDIRQLCADVLAADLFRKTTTQGGSE